MASLRVLNNWQLNVGGLVRGGAQGGSSQPFFDPASVTVAGTIHGTRVVVPTATVLALWDDDDDSPTNFDYFWVKADVAAYLQLVGATSSVVIPLVADTPFVLSGGDQILGAGSTTDITGGTEPTLEDIDHINLGNYSGGDATVEYAVID